MQVSAISTSEYTVFRNVEGDGPEAIPTAAEIQNKTFTSLPNDNAASNTDFDSINEWKDFCHSQILANNLDYMA